MFRWLRHTMTSCVPSGLHCIAGLLVLALAFDQGFSILCVQCENLRPNDTAECLTVFPPPTNCTTCTHAGGGATAQGEQPCLQYEVYESCLINKKFSENGTLLTISRGCNPFFSTSSCHAGEDRATGQPVKLCNYICHTDGCNTGGVSIMRGATLHPWWLGVHCVVVVGVVSYLSTVHQWL